MGSDATRKGTELPLNIVVRTADDPGISTSGTLAFGELTDTKFHAINIEAGQTPQGRTFAVIVAASGEREPLSEDEIKGILELLHSTLHGIIRLVGDGEE